MADHLMTPIWGAIQQATAILTDVRKESALRIIAIPFLSLSLFLTISVEYYLREITRKVHLLALVLLLLSIFQ